MILLERDLTQVPERVRRELIRGEHARAELTLHRQRAIAEACKSIDFVHMEGFGQRKLIPLDPELVGRLRVGYGDDCLHDPAFVRSLWEKNPMLRANCRARKFTIRVNGLRGEQGNVQRSRFNVQRSIPDVRNTIAGGGRDVERSGPHEAGGPHQGDPATPGRTGHVSAAAAGESLVIAECGTRSAE